MHATFGSRRLSASGTSDGRPGTPPLPSRAPHTNLEVVEAAAERPERKEDEEEEKPLGSLDYENVEEKRDYYEEVQFQGGGNLGGEKNDKVENERTEKDRDEEGNYEEVEVNNKYNTTSSYHDPNYENTRRWEMSTDRNLILTE